MPEQQPPSQPVMYGIPNCDTIKKARNWLKQHDVDYRFHDYKKQGVEPAQLRLWVDQLGWENLINKRGTSWRKLDESTRMNMDNELAIKVMLDNPSIIKRPLLVVQEHILLGYDEVKYQQEFGQA